METRPLHHARSTTPAPPRPLLVSVIIPTYNRADTVGHAVESVRAQTFTNYEIIVVDDGSRDNTAAVVARFGDAVRYIAQLNGGVAVARNRGVAEARGRYVAFLDSDDAWLPAKLERQMALVAQRPELGFVYAEARAVDESGRELGTKPAQRPVSDTLETLLQGNFIPTLTVVARRDAVQAVGGFDPQLRGPEDYDLWMRLAARYPFAGVRETLAVYYQSSAGLSGDPNKIYAEYLKIFRKLLGHEEFAMHRAQVRRRLAMSHYLLAKGRYDQARFAEARREFAAALRVLPGVGSVFIESSDGVGQRMAKRVKPYAAVVSAAARAVAASRQDVHSPQSTVHSGKGSCCGPSTMDHGRSSVGARRVLFIETGTGFGGSSVALYHIIKHLDRARFMPIVVSYSDGENIRKIAALGVETCVAPPNDPRRHPWLCRIPTFGFWYRTVPYAAWLVRFCRRQAIELVHVNNGILTQIPAIAAAGWLRLPCVCYIQGVEPVTWIQRPFIRMVSRYLFITEQMKPAYRLERFVSPERLQTVLPHGVDLETFKPTVDARQTRRELGLSESDRVVVVVSRLVPGKGHDDLLRAAPQVLQRVPNARFVIVGDCPPGQTGGITDDLKRLSRELSLNGAVVFTGWRDDIPAMMQMADVVALPSHSEGLGRVLLEAMAFGKPTVGTRVGGIPSVIVEGETGLLVPPKEPPALAEALTLLLASPDRARQMGEAGYRRVETEFSMPAVMRRLEAVYGELLERDESGVEDRA